MIAGTYATPGFPVPMPLRGFRCLCHYGDLEKGDKVPVVAQVPETDADKTYLEWNTDNWAETNSRT